MIEETVGKALTIDARDADEVVRGSRLIADLARIDPPLVTGPLSKKRQIWIGSGRSGKNSPLREQHFVSAASVIVEPSSKPFGIGLFTSTSGFESHGMWYLHLDNFRGSSLNPLPWHIWQVTPSADAAVLEIASARDWVGFVENRAIVSGGFMCPNWAATAERFDAVHLTISAVAAIQGLTFIAPSGLTRPAFWDVESTLWLNWQFQDVQRISFEV
jgi:hypothetical protein